MLSVVVLTDALKGMLTAMTRTPGMDARATEVPPLDRYLADAKAAGRQVLVPLEVRNSMRRQLDEQGTIRLQRALKQGIKDGTVVKSRHRFTLRREFKELSYRIRRSYPELTEGIARALALALQEDAEIETLDERLQDILDRVRLVLRRPCVDSGKP